MVSGQLFSAIFETDSRSDIHGNRPIALFASLVTRSSQYALGCSVRQRRHHENSHQDPSVVDCVAGGAGAAVVARAGRLAKGKTGGPGPGEPRGRARGRGRARNKDDPGVWCYTCFADFEKIPLSIFNPGSYIYNNLCYNPALNYSLTDHEYLTKCSEPTRYCMVDITRLNGVLLSVDRRCGASTCRKTCLSRGYGTIRETCTYCCGGRINEDNRLYNEEMHSIYRCPDEPH